MVCGLSESQRLRADKPTGRRTPLGGILRRLNARVESRVRSGFGSPGLLPAGLIVLETTGRRSGQAHRTPLLATMAPGGFLWISTVLGRRANWLRNAYARPDVRYWLGGCAREGRALVSAAGYAIPDLDELPPSLRWAAARALKVSRALGFGVVIIVPQAVHGPTSA
jgi:deazaflavin-dependent oxidoreductase (nitroreductase family)